MVRRLALFCLLTAALHPAFALSVHADRRELALGQALTLEVRAQGAGPSLDAIGLDALKGDFEVYGASAATSSRVRSGRTQTERTLTLTLYPLRPGRLRLPALSLGGQSSRPIEIRVLPAGPGVPRVSFKVGLDPAAPLVRQAATLHLDVYDDGSLQWSPPDLPETPGLHLRRLGEEQREEILDGASYTVHRYRWEVMPLQDGKLELAFPTLDATKFGAHLRYRVPPFSFSARPLPAYLPVYVPVGRPSLTAAPLPARLVVDRPIEWVLTVRAAGLSREGLARLLSPAAAGNGLRFYPPLVSRLDPVPQTLPQQVWRVAFPLRPVRSGVVRLPEVSLPYYDPAAGRVEAVTFAGPSLEVVDPLWRGIRIAAGVAAGLLLAAGLGYRLRARLRRALARRAALGRVARADSPQALGTALRAFDPAGGAPCATLGQWLRRMEGRRGADARLGGLVTALEAARFAPGGPGESLAGLKRQAAAALKGLGPGEPAGASEESWRSALFRPAARPSGRFSRPGVPARAKN